MPLARVSAGMQYADSIDQGVRDSLRGQQRAVLERVDAGRHQDERDRDVRAGHAPAKLWRSSRTSGPAAQRAFTGAATTPRIFRSGSRPYRPWDAQPANVVFHPADRDRAWLQLFDRTKGSINLDFGFLAFSTPPLAAAHSLDAKITTTALARELTTYAKFGPPLGHTWIPTDAQKLQHPTIAPLVGNDWVMLHLPTPSTGEAAPRAAVDLARMSPDTNAQEPPDRERPPAWRGTLLPECEADTWLAAAFADYERIVALDIAQGAVPRMAVLHQLTTTSSPRPCLDRRRAI